MRSDWKGPFSRRLQKAASERGRRMANQRWRLDQERRNRLAVLTAEQHPAKIVRRIVVIDNETTVKEAVIWSFDSGRSRKRKEKEVLRQC